ncbi:MAG: polysaccharide pyruvyl transferase family protein [Pirellulaceae bacterium]
MLVDPERFAPIFDRLHGKRVGFYPLSGNVGDSLIELATIQLLGRFGIAWRYIRCVVRDGGCATSDGNHLSSPRVTCIDPDDLDQVDEILVNGGGNMGMRYPVCHQQRRVLRKATLRPITILPQSFCDDKENATYDRVFVREETSLRFYPRAIVAPDMAMGYQWPTPPPPPVHDLAIAMRLDGEAIQVPISDSFDPIQGLSTAEQYLCRAASYREVITDRLHFAISALLAGRDVTLVANNYHKNEAVWRLWLKPLGCKFSTREEIAKRFA